MQASARLSSSAASKKVIAGASSAITRSCYRTSRGKAHAAPLSAQEPPPKGQKRITKQERRVRIVEFVDKFRASNDGKFPSVTNVRQQVGGSHYTVREVLQELEYNHTKLPLGNAKAAPLQQTVEVAEHSRPKEDIVKNPSNCDSSKSSEKIQDVDDVLISQKDAATSTGIVEKAAYGSALSDQTESESMKVITNKFSVSLGVEAISDPGNQQRETEANRLAMKSAEKFVNASELIASDQSGNDKLIDANIHGREHKPKHTPEDSTSSGLFGSLKSFAYGIRSFWKKL